MHYCDPWVPLMELGGERHYSVEWSEAAVREADCVVMLTPHRQFLEQPHWNSARLVVDTRNVTEPGANIWRI